MILNHVQRQLDELENKEVSEMLYEFPAGWSTLHAVQKVYKRVDKAFFMKRKPGGFCAVVILDKKTAYNTANWEHIY